LGSPFVWPTNALQQEVKQLALISSTSEAPAPRLIWRLFEPDPYFKLDRRLSNVEYRLTNLETSTVVGFSSIFALISVSALFTEKRRTEDRIDMREDMNKMVKQRAEDLARMELQRADDLARMGVQRSDDKKEMDLKFIVTTLVATIVPFLMQLSTAKLPGAQ